MLNPETTTTEFVEPTAPSKMDRVKATAGHAAYATAISIGPAALFAGVSFLNLKANKVAFDTAKLALETARITNPS